MMCLSNPAKKLFLRFIPGKWEVGELSVRDGMHPQPTKLQVVFQVLSFGDGTGLFGCQRNALSAATQTTMSLDRRVRQPNNPSAIGSLILWLGFQRGDRLRDLRSVRRGRHVFQILFKRPLRIAKSPLRVI